MRKYDYDIYIYDSDKNKQNYIILNNEGKPALKLDPTIERESQSLVKSIGRRT